MYHVCYIYFVPRTGFCKMIYLTGFTSPEKMSTKAFLQVYSYLDTVEIDFIYHMQLAGGTASMQQLKERLEKDLLEVDIMKECFSVLSAVAIFQFTEFE